MARVGVKELSLQIGSVVNYNATISCLAQSLACHNVFLSRPWTSYSLSGQHVKTHRLHQRISTNS